MSESSERSEELDVDRVEIELRLDRVDGLLGREVEVVDVGKDIQMIIQQVLHGSANRSSNEIYNGLLLIQI